MRIRRIRVASPFLATAAVAALVLAGCSADTPGSASDSGSGTDTSGNALRNGLDAIAQLPPAPAGPDDIPVRTPEGGAARYGTPKGILVQRYTGSLTGERRTVWDSYGILERHAEDMHPYPADHPGPKENTMRIANRKYFYILDVDRKVGNVDTNTGEEQYLSNDTLGNVSLGDYLMAMANDTVIGDTVVNGYHLQIRDQKGPGYHVQRYVWRGLSLAEHLTQTATAHPDEFWLIPVKLDLSPTLADSMFTAPSDYKLVHGRPMERMPGVPDIGTSREHPPGPPGGMGPGAAQPPGAVVPQGAAPPGK